MQKEVLADTERRMKKSIASLEQNYTSVRTGKASVQMLDGIEVDYYGTATPLNQVGSISAPEAQLLVVQPWEKAIVGEVVKAIQKSDLGLNPQADGQVVRIPVPPLTEERRRDLVKVIKKMAEEAKVAIRNIRRDANDALKKLEKEKKLSEDLRKDGEEDVQTLTDTYIERCDEVALEKESEVMEI